MILRPEQNLSILISLAESLVAAPSKHEKFFEITEKGPGSSEQLDKYVKALRARFSGWKNGDDTSKKARLLAIAEDLKSSSDKDEKIAGTTLGLIVARPERRDR